METFKTIQNICCNIGLICVFTMLIIYPFLYFSITIKFNKLFGKKRDNAGLFHPGIILSNGMAHTTTYATCIVFSKRIKNPNARVSFNYDRFFDHYDFRANVNNLQIFLCITYLFSCYLACILGLIAFGPGLVTGAIIWFKTVFSLL